MLIYHTLEIKHPDFIDDNGNPITIFLVQGFHNITAKLETGKNVEFQAMCFNIELPPVDTSAVPEITVEIDNVSREIGKHATNLHDVLCEFRKSSNYNPHLWRFNQHNA